MAIQKLFSSLSNAAAGGTYVGEAGRLFYDPVRGLRVSDGSTPGGQPIPVAVTAANIGDLVITGGSISTINPNEDLTLVANGTGSVNVYGSFKVRTDGLNSTTSFDVNPNGFTTINVPTLGTGQNGLLINGGTVGAMAIPQVAGTTLRLVGNDGVSNTMAIDAFGVGTFPGTINRAGRGTSASPTATKTGDTIGRWGAVGYGDTNFVIDNGIGRAASDIRFVATEDFTDSHGGTQIQFYTSPNGGTQRTLSVTMDYTGITTGNIHSTNVFVSGNTISTGTTQAIGNFTANGTSNLVGVVTTQGNLNVIGNFTGNGTSIMLGTTQAIGNFTANGTSNLVGIVTTQGNLNVIGNISIDGTSINTGTTLMIGNTTTIGTTTLTGDVHIAGNVDTTGATASFGTAAFTGAVTIDGPMTINNQISVTALGNIKFNDGTIQTTSAVGSVANSNHATLALGVSGTTKTLTVSTDATPSNVPSTIVSRNSVGDIAVGNITATNISTTSVTGNTSIAGSMIVYGNLQVVGTTTSVNSTQLSISSLTLTVANNASTGSQADSAAFLVGTNGEFADWTYDNSQRAWRSNVSLVPATTLDGENLGSPTRQWGNVYAGEAYFSNKLNVGVTPTVGYNTIAQFTGNVNTWNQLTNQNLNAGTTASTDFIATNDIGTDTANYIDMGINSSVNADPDYTIQKANDGYLYVNGGNITLGTQSTGSDIVFFTDGTLTANEAGRVHLGRWILGGVDNGVDKLQVTGNVTVGNIAATNLTNKFATITANAVSLQNQITGANAAIVTANTGLKAYVDGQVNTLNTTITTANTNVVSYVNGQITTVTTAWQANAAGQANQITGANTNISTNTTAIATLNANVGAYELFANANVAGLQNQITGANTNIATGVTNFNTLNANVGAFETYANTAISSITTNANANTAAYLSIGITTNIVTTGNVSAGNVLVGSTNYSNLSITSTATAADFTIGQTGATGNLILNRQTNFAKDAHVTGNVTVSANVTAANVNATLHGNVIGVASSLGTNTTSFATTFLTGQVNIPSQTIAKNTLAQDLTVTVTGLTTSHKVIVTPAADLNPGIVIGAAYPSSANTLGVQLQNPNGGAITTSAFNLTYMAWI